MSLRSIALALALALAVMQASSATNHPVEKVVDLLKKLSEKAVEEGKAEEVSFNKFSYWCSTSKSELNKAIEEEKATIDELDSSIEGYKKQKEALGGQVKELEGEIADLQAAAKSSKENDEQRNKLYQEKRNNLESTIKAVDDAIVALQEASKTDSMLLQQGAQKSVQQVLALLAAKASDRQRSILVDFVSGAGAADPKVMGDLGKHTKKYSFKSDNVIDLLKELKTKFEDDLTSAVTEETNAANAFALEKAARDNAQKAATKSKTQKANMLADVSSSLADAEANMKDEKADLKADSDTLDSTSQACSTKTREWQQRSETRSQEIEAISMAIKILGKVTGVRTEAPGNPIPPSSPVKLLQIDDPKAEAVQLLRTTAKTVHSKALERLALEVSTHLAGPFDKVNDMIQKMIFRLMSEQTDEDKHKAWCDLELEKTKTSESDKSDKIKELDAKVAEVNAKVQKLTDDITDADKMVSDITTFMQEATEIRSTGKQENTLAIKDAKQAQTAIANAVSVLEDFYKSSGQVKKEPWEFVQKSSDPVKLPEDPKLWDSSYTGVADPKKAETGVIAILEKIAADFSKMEAETTAQEVEDQKKFDEQMKSHKVEKARRQQESNAKMQEKKRLISKITSMTSQKKHTSDELDAVKQYSKDLMPACVDGDSTYADRKAARAKEVKALKDAQAMLQDAFKAKKSSAFLDVRRHD